MQFAYWDEHVQPLLDLIFGFLCDSTPYPQVIQFGESSMFFGDVFCVIQPAGWQVFWSVNACMS